MLLSIFMEIRNFNIGEKVLFKTKSREWEGIVLESYDPSIILLKLVSGYNVGIRESEILDAKVMEKVKFVDKKSFSFKKDKELRNVAILITGGTISSRLDSKTGGVIFTDAEEILNIAPEIGKICNVVRIEKPFMKWSENMSFADWKNLSDICESLLNDKDIDGLIITHGTDFLHYTSSVLSFFLQKINKPIALTYSQRSIDRGSTDAALNLICAAKYAVSDIAEISLIGHKDLNDEFCLAMPGTKVRKMHTSRRDAFKVVNCEPFAEISKNDFKILRSFNARSDVKVKSDSKYLEKVAMIKVYPGQDPAILDYYEKEGYLGIILEVTGIGQVPSKEARFNWLPKIKKIVDGGVFVCAVPQTIYGRLNPNVYSAGRELNNTGIIFLEDMLAETAFVKLSWVLGHKTWAKDKNKIKEKMLENSLGEFSERITP